MSDELPLPPDQCEKDAECLEAYGSLHYIPNAPLNYVSVGFFAAILIAQIWLGIRHKTWGFMAAMIGGTVLEVVGYVGRILMIGDIFDQNNFIIYLVGLTIGPAFYGAAIYLSLSRIITVFGTGLCWFKPRTVTITWIGFDVVSLLLQSAGGAISSMADTQSQSDLGINIMIAGLATQVAATTAFCAVCLQLWLWVRRYPQRLSVEYAPFRKSSKFKMYLWVLGIAVVAILVRCIFRLLELSGGYDSELANHELTFVLFDSLMMAIMCLALTIGHPGLLFGEYWDRATFSFRTKKTSAMEPFRKQFDDGSRSGSEVNLHQPEFTPLQNNLHQPEFTPLQNLTEYQPGYQRVSNA
ncbi:uncharacterized protein Z518_08074 [Rhinocladiella mackenziei CBS 650.93]|uniref:RTA1 domain protein n=1 Tax=Rhinocladiella mackenziei CBS 650.93 TaxID=1442369 RepID=A0A0D2IZU0_9EURO|nr:uncharacterized protein Z518_08074 [Rhinocladiella mackenziei CBS 650.93]KIX02135.1 hypothetical protein Z518_08074 [Rhinocladiella mackenziei CBS 650.93]